MKYVYKMRIVNQGYKGRRRETKSNLWKPPDAIEEMDKDAIREMDKDETTRCESKQHQDEI